MKTPSFIAPGFLMVALAACGSPEAQAPAALDSVSSLDPIDAVPLPLDDNPMAPAAVAAPVEKAADKAATADKLVGDTDAAVPTTVAEARSAPDAKTPRIVVTPRGVVPSTRPPAPAPASGEPEKPVLIF